MDAGRLDAKPLYRHLDSLFSAVDGQRPRKMVMESVLEELFLALHRDLRLRGGVLYAPSRDGLRLLSQVGDVGETPPDTLESDLPPLRLVFAHGVYIFADPYWDDAPARFGLLPPAPAAGLAVGPKPHRYVLLFLLDAGWAREELDFALNTVRAALGARLMEERLRGGLNEAAQIQQSLLLEDPPAFAGYELAARSVPAEEVGGDFFDFLSLDDALLGLAIGDASGHGLPAALLVRLLAERFAGVYGWG
jgi:sigma-B regulation protein RsbU (phosphoserine phosphatase)